MAASKNFVGMKFFMFQGNTKGIYTHRPLNLASILSPGRMDPRFHVVYANFCPYDLGQHKLRLVRPDKFLPIFYCLILVRLCEL